MEEKKSSQSVWECSWEKMRVRKERVIYIYIYIERERDSEGERERETECVCVWERERKLIRSATSFFAAAGINNHISRLWVSRRYKSLMFWSDTLNPKKNSWLNHLLWTLSIDLLKTQICKFSLSSLSRLNIFYNKVDFG
jgi:hypothetical protein